MGDRRTLGEAAGEEAVNRICLIILYALVGCLGGGLHAADQYWVYTPYTYWDEDLEMNIEVPGLVFIVNSPSSEEIQSMPLGAFNPQDPNDWESSLYHAIAYYVDADGVVPGASYDWGNLILVHPPASNYYDAAFVMSTARRDFNQPTGLYYHGTSLAGHYEAFPIVPGGNAGSYSTITESYYDFTVSTEPANPIAYPGSTVDITLTITGGGAPTNNWDGLDVAVGVGGYDTPYDQYLFVGATVVNGQAKVRYTHKSMTGGQLNVGIDALFWPGTVPPEWPDNFDPQRTEEPLAYGFNSYPIFLQASENNPVLLPGIHPALIA